MIELSCICEFVRDKIPVENLSEVNYVSTENMLPNRKGITKSTSLPTLSQTQKFSEHDTLVSNIRPYFKKIWFSNYDGGCSNDVLILRAKKGIYPRYLYYVLSSDGFFKYATSTSKGTKMPRGDKKAIMEYKIPSHSYKTQIKIADFLEKLDKKIELNKQINNNLAT
ncbi:restriction endonuclease subunit S [Amedibacillus sp. YH-ame10]